MPTQLHSRLRMSYMIGCLVSVLFGLGACDGTSFAKPATYSAFAMAWLGNGTFHMNQTPSPTETPTPSGAVNQPLIFTLYGPSGVSPNALFNILIVPDSKFGDLNVDENYGKFLAVIAPLYSEGMLYNNVINLNIRLFSISVTTVEADVSTSGTICPNVNLPPNVYQIRSGDPAVLKPNIVVVVHKETGVSDCAWQGNPRVIAIGMSQLDVGKLNKEAPRIIVHEIGHTFGLPDEYTGAQSYWKALPLLYENETVCEHDANNQTWLNGQNCQMLTTEDERTTFWRSELHPNIMSAGGETVLEFGPGEWFIVDNYFETQLGASQTPTGTAGSAAKDGRIHPPCAFAPADWDPVTHHCS